MNDIFRRRLIGLAILLVVVFFLSFLLPRGATQLGHDNGLPSTTVALDGSSPPSEATAVSVPPPKLAEQLTPPDVQSSTRYPPLVNETAPKKASITAPPVKPLPQPVMPPKMPPPNAAVESKPIKPVPVIPAMASQLSTPPAKPSPPAPAPLPIAPLPVAKAVEPAASKPTTGTLWYVQIGSFADTGNAQTTLSLLQNIGYHGESSKIVSGTGATLYRVRLGPFPTETVARQAFDKVSGQGYPQARVLSETQPK